MESQKTRTPSSNLGTISYEQFLDGIEPILQTSPDGGIWSKQFINKADPTIPAPGSNYLSFTQILDHHEPSEAAPDLIRAEYHIVYSLSYSVPVLYFNYYFSSGKLLTIEQINRQASLGKVGENLLQNISQQEHPLLNIPFYFLHPCHTESLMEGLKIQDAQAYMFSWLSIVSNLFGIPNCQLFEKLKDENK